MKDERHEPLPTARDRSLELLLSRQVDSCDHFPGQRQHSSSLIYPLSDGGAFSAHRPLSGNLTHNKLAWQKRNLCSKQFDAPPQSLITEYNRLSLSEILALTDDLLLSDELCCGTKDEDPLMTKPIFPVAIPTTTEPQVPDGQATSTPTTTAELLLMQTMPGGEIDPLPSLSDHVADFMQFLGDSCESASKSNSPNCAHKKTSEAIACSVVEKEEQLCETQDRSALDLCQFRHYQEEQWNVMYEQLCAYRNRMGHCNVPYTDEENAPLARWIKRQRFQYKLMREGKQSTAVPERVEALEKIGFVWDSQNALWRERLDQLKYFKEANGHCNVPSGYAENIPLATWVKCQRRQYKLYQAGKPSYMTQDRIDELVSLGFEWELRNFKRRRLS